MYTVFQLARACGLSRGALLYFESIGLLRAPPRTSGNYRLYDESDLRRLEQICVYRNAGVKLRDIRAILDSRQGGGAAAVLKKRLCEIQREIEELRNHQRAILALLQNRDSLRRTNEMTKDKWVSILKDAGFSEQDMHRWHGEFERSAPGDHQEFLEYLHLASEEARRIREWSRSVPAQPLGGGS